MGRGVLPYCYFILTGECCRDVIDTPIRIKSLCGVTSCYRISPGIVALAVCAGAPLSVGQLCRVPGRSTIAHTFMEATDMIQAVNVFLKHGTNKWYILGLFVALFFLRG